MASWVIVGVCVAGVPFLIVCTTRPELFERRPGWSGGKRNALAISLGPLSDEETALIEKIIDAFDFGMVGIDFIFDKAGRFLFNEIE